MFPDELYDTLDIRRRGIAHKFIETGPVVLKSMNFSLSYPLKVMPGPSYGQILISITKDTWMKLVYCYGSREQIFFKKLSMHIYFVVIISPWGLIFKLESPSFKDALSQFKFG